MPGSERDNCVWGRRDGWGERSGLVDWEVEESKPFLSKKEQSKYLLLEHLLLDNSPF